MAPRCVLAAIAALLWQCAPTAAATLNPFASRAAYAAPLATNMTAGGAARAPDPLYVVGRQFPLDPPTEVEIAVPTPATPGVILAGYEEGPLFPEELPPGWTDSSVHGNPECWTDQSVWCNVVGDHLNFYSPRGLIVLGVGVGVAAVLANTPVDQGIADGYQDHIHTGSGGMSRVVHQTKTFGNGWVTMPICAAATVAGLAMSDRPAMNTVGDWGQRSLRTALVGGPPLLFLQFATGGSRPGEDDNGSQWRPFADNNGASGHAFMGAVPFMVAAKMTENIWLKSSLYGASLLCGWSRIDDNHHYASQVVLGWWLAYAAATAVDMTQSGESNFNVVPLPLPDAAGLGLEWRR
jgi:membrane-associated phospholipid phosphatase